jgi:protein-tyrosine phosphatase
MHRREFLMTALASGGVAAAPGAFARALLEGEAIRASTDALSLKWNAPDQPASILVATDPDAPRGYMRQLKAGVRGGKAEFPLPVSPRPYFLVSTADGAQVRLAERLLPLQGGRNFRDLGGYRTADGRQVRWGRIYRSGVMSALTPGDMTYLAGLGVEVICDLRSSQERRTEPNPFLKTDAPQVVATDYEMSAAIGDLQRATTREAAVSAFADGYVQFLDVLRPQFTDLFDRLVRRETPLAFNCSAGKDRTGMGSALILSVLGVPRETVVADYALTQVYTPPSGYMRAMAAGSGAGASGITPEMAKAFSRMPHDVLMVLMGSDPAVMRQALAQVDAKFGGPAELAKARFGLTDAKIAHLRQVYLI